MIKKIAALLLACTLLLSLAGCGDTYPEINQKLTWDAINAIPIKRTDMTEDEMRQLCVDFFSFSKTALWTPDETWTYEKYADGSLDTIEKGQLYGGLPYINVASGNIYRLMDYIDEETGIVDMTIPKTQPKLFGGQCSISAFWGWARVINSANLGWTYQMVQCRGCLRVGPYTYDDKLPEFDRDVYTTADVVEENGEQIMFQSYAAMDKADGLVCYVKSGHAMMCHTAPVVVYNDDGTINGEESYLLVNDQTSSWVEVTNEAGDTFLQTKREGGKFTFRKLFEQSYIPFTFAEFLGTDPVEETEVTFSHTADTITPSQLMGSAVVCNYSISDIYATVTDSAGKLVDSCVKRAEVSDMRTLSFMKSFDLSQWNAYADQGYTVEVYCQLGTGERPTLYTGQLVK